MAGEFWVIVPSTAASIAVSNVPIQCHPLTRYRQRPPSNVTLQRSSPMSPPQCHPSNVIPNVPPNVTIAGYPQHITLQSHPQTSPLPRHLNVLPPMSPSHLIPNVPPQRASLRHLQQSQKSPAMGGCLLWHSGRVRAGRCGHFDRTCHKRMPLSNV